MLHLILLLPGFVLLYFAAEYLIDSASEIAVRLNLSKAFVGLTIVAFGTSAPEMVVNLIAALSDEPGASNLALGNIAGSNLTNICLGIGGACLLFSLPGRQKTFRLDLAICLIAVALTATLLLITRPSELPFYAVAPFGLMLVFYLVALYRKRNDPTMLEGVPDEDDTKPMWKDILILLASAVGLYLGGQFVYNGAMYLASPEVLNIPADIVGLTIVACGTSIPDVTATIVAAKKREDHLAIGNILGSNISNILVVLTGTIIASGGGLLGNRGSVIDYLAATILTAAVAVLLLGKFGTLKRLPGVLLLVTFFGYYVVRIAFLRS